VTQVDPQAVAEVAYRAGFRGDALVTIVAIAGAESGYRTDAVGDVGLQTGTWGPSVGLTQVRSLNAEKGKGTDRDELANYDPLHNLTAAYHISGGGANFRPWSTYTNGAYRKFVDAATSAASSAGGGAGAYAAAGAASAVGMSPNDWRSGPPIPTDDRLQPIAGYGDSPTSSPGFPFTIRGRTLEGRIDDYIVEGHVSLSVEQIWQVDLTFDDPGLAGLWETGLFDIGTPVDTADIHWKVGAVQVQQGPANEQVAVALRTAGAEDLKSDRRPRTEQNVSPYVYVAHEAAAVGLEVTGGKIDHSLYAVRPSVGRNPALAADPTSRGESGWEAIQRIAGEVGAWAWEGGLGLLYFGSPRRFVAELIGFDVVWRPGPGQEHLAPLECPTCRRTNDDPLLLAEVSVKLPPSRGHQVRPGMRLTLSGVKGFEDSYIVKSVEWDLDGGISPVTVTAVTPRDPIPSDVNEQATNPLVAGAKAVAGSGNALDFVNFALKQAGKKYVYGGKIDDNDPDPSSFDCSELVEWAAHQVGVEFRRPSGTQYAAAVKAGTTIPVDQALSVRGAVLFMGAGGSQHIAISLGDGKTTIEARGRAYGVMVTPNASTRGFTLAALVPGMVYNGQSTPVAGDKYRGTVVPGHGTIS
jgi:cell wall-associated NlpC family hydrolase